MVDYDRDDYDGDGWQDVYLITAAELSAHANRL
jgi:hypothetical protein